MVAQVQEAKVWVVAPKKDYSYGYRAGGMQKVLPERKPTRRNGIMAIGSLAKPHIIGLSARPTAQACYRSLLPPPHPLLPDGMKLL